MQQPVFKILKNVLEVSPDTISASDKNFLAYLSIMAGAKPIKAETYKIELLPDSDEEEEKPVPPVANMTSATDLITSLLEQNSIQYAVMGGFAIHLLERPRETRDIDVCFVGGFKHVREILEQQPR